MNRDKGLGLSSKILQTRAKEKKVGRSCGKKMMSRIYPNLEANSPIQPMNTLCTLDSRFFSWPLAISF